uniref:Uncharacterized protein n=1 Tax=Oryza nivara TaxID=4536 RepID=A0A0E0GPB3_ORYNI
MTPPAPALLLACSRRRRRTAPHRDLPLPAPYGCAKFIAKIHINCCSMLMQEVCKKISKVMVVDKLTRLEAADRPARCCSSISAVASSTLAADPPATVASGLPPIEVSKN